MSDRNSCSPPPFPLPRRRSVKVTNAPASVWLLRKKIKQMRLQQHRRASDSNELHLSTKNQTQMLTTTLGVTTTSSTSSVTSSTSRRVSFEIYDELRERGVNEAEALSRQRIYSKLTQYFDNAD
mmetsp:Transcript_2781/g.4156  ORF Transcript_2781/g.4156 Transcript_2781/m.4156 type:complete len:124 (-) Transcript_2781:50-421(-)